MYMIHMNDIKGGLVIAGLSFLWVLGMYFCYGGLCYE
jgi:hypothetical protein